MMTLSFAVALLPLQSAQAVYALDRWLDKNQRKSPLAQKLHQLPKSIEHKLLDHQLFGGPRLSVSRGQCDSTE